MFLGLIGAAVLAAYMLLQCRDRLPWFLAALAYVLLILLSAFYWLSDQFTGEGITEAVFFHLLHGLNGGVLLAFSGYVALALAAILLVVLSVYGFWRAGQWPRLFSAVGRGRESLVVLLIGALAVFTHPASGQLLDFIKQRSVAASIDLGADLYPLQLPGKLEARKNLVFIYAESLEGLFLNDEIFPGLTPNLNALAADSLRIRGIGQAPLTDWTIAAMVASQCSMALAPLPPPRELAGEAYVSGSTCLGDILQRAGYHTVFIGGADLGFAGKGRFYQEHGFAELIGKDQLQGLADQPLALSQWGVYDDDLLQVALKRYQQLVDQEQPFALFVLTLDTHPPQGHVTPSCQDIAYADGRSGMLNAVKCADSLLAAFIKNIEAKAADDLVLVLASDHLQMRTDSDDVMGITKAQRENLFLVRGAEVAPGEITRMATMLDVFPSVLNLLGWQVEGAALGRNLFLPQPTLVETYGRDVFYEALRKWRMQIGQARVKDGDQ